MKYGKFAVVLLGCLCLFGCGRTIHSQRADVPDKQREAVQDEADHVLQDEEYENVSIDGAHVFLYHTSEDPVGISIYEGFKEYMEKKGERTVYLVPEKQDTKEQIVLLERILEQNAASVTVSPSGGTGYGTAVQTAVEAEIPMITVDSMIETEQKICHIDPVAPEEIGTLLVQTAVLIALRIDYPEDGQVEALVQSSLQMYTGEELMIGVLATDEEVPVQKEWIDAMQAELSKEVYAGKVSSELDVKYGKNESASSKVQVGAFLREGQVDCIVATTAVGLRAAAEVLHDNESRMGLTGMGILSTMQPYMPMDEQEDTFSFVCPYMLSWDFSHLGAVAAAAIYAEVCGSFSGVAGETFDMSEFRDYSETTYKAYTDGNGIGILAGIPFVCYKGNITKWKFIQ